MRGDELNEWQIPLEEDEHDSITMEPAVEKRGNQMIFHFPDRRLSMPASMRRAISPAKSTRTSTPLWQTITPEGLLSRRFNDSRESFKTLKVCHNCNEAIIKTSKGIRSVRISRQLSNSHINNVVLQLNNPEVKIENTLPTATHSPSVIRIKRPEFDYKSLKIQTEDDKGSRPYRSCMPKSSHLHSRKFSVMYHEAVKKQQERKEVLKKIPRRKRKKFMAKVSPQAPDVQFEQKIDAKPEPLKKDRRMLNFRMEERKSITYQPQLISESTLFDILRFRREIKLGILTNHT